MNLVAFVGNDKEGWGQITALMNRMPDCEKIVLVKNKTSDDFPTNEITSTITIDSTKPVLDLTQELLPKLQKELSDGFEVALSLASGNGKEHMALLSALLSVPVGVRVVAYTKDGVTYLT